MLIPIWEGSLSVPPLPLRRVKIGKNLVVQRPFLGATCKAQIFDYETPGHLLAKTDLSGPFSELILRCKGAKRADVSSPMLSAPSSDPAKWSSEIASEWDPVSQLTDYCATPEQVLAAWINKFNFREEDVLHGLDGLRTPQIGALHAICAHFAVGKEFDAATVVLPTGTGKTETMLATLVYRRLERTLVIAPSTVLRGQIAKKFVTLGVLPKAGIVPKDIACPRVAIVEHGIQSTEEVQELLRQSNVIVALPNALAASDEAIAAALVDGCTDLMVDEAHHITADTWSSVKARFSRKRVLQFTATPFRQDGKRVDGKIIFNYKLGDAQDAGYYRPIALKAVEEYGDEEARDRAIAAAAIAALRRDREELGLDHLLMARTWKKDRAEAILKLYQELAPDLRPVVVYTGAGRQLKNREALWRVLDRGPDGARIVVCVNMLGEGFDLPNLKIAALHDTHKSLAITLQFVGRFTRTGSEASIGDATAVANIADPAVESKLADLYAEGADWDKLIRQLSEERISSELRLQEVVLGLKQSGDLANQLSLWNLRPALSAQFYHTRCDSWDPQRYASALPKGAQSWFAFNESEDVLVAVIRRETQVGWGNYQNLEDTIYDLLILRWDRERRVLCLFASDYDVIKTDQIADAVTGEQAKLLSGAPIFRILNNVEMPLVKSLGSSRVGAISFTSYFGPNVTEGLAHIEKAESELNNIACLGYEGGERVLWGGAQRRGKIWQVKSGTIAQWIAWTAHAWGKLTAQDDGAANITSDFLRPKRMDGPHGEFPISVQWGEQAQLRLSDRQAILFGDTEVPLIMVDLDIASVADDGAITVRLSSEAHTSMYVLRIAKALAGGYRHEHVSGPSVQFRKGRGEPLSLEEYLRRDPFIIRYADGTYSYNCYHIATNLSAGTFDRSRIETWDWSDIPINREAMTQSNDPRTIQHRAFEQLRDQFDLVFNDDGPGEVADLVCLRDVDAETIHLCLVHCKGAHGGVVSRDIRNFYVVCGQAQKNITAKHKGLGRLYHDLKRRHDFWAQAGASRFLKGNIKQLSIFKEKARRAKLTFEVILVQPGASARTVTEEGLRLLATTELFLVKTTDASFRVITSP